MLGEIQYDGELSMSAYAVLVSFLVLIVGGYGFCFMRAISGSNEKVEEQRPDEE